MGTVDPALDLIKAPSEAPLGRLSQQGDIVEVQSARAQVPPLHTVDAIIAEGQWAKAVEQLAPGEAVLPAQHKLVYALALKECGAEGEQARRADTLAIQSLAALLDLPETSSLVLVLARRMLVRRTWRQAPAPKAHVQVVLVVAAVLIGAAVGWAWDEWHDRHAAQHRMVQ